MFASKHYLWCAPHDQRIRQAPTFSYLLTLFTKQSVMIFICNLHLSHCSRPIMGRRWNRMVSAGYLLYICISPSNWKTFQESYHCCLFLRRKPLYCHKWHFPIYKNDCLITLKATSAFFHSRMNVQELCLITPFIYTLHTKLRLECHAPCSFKLGSLPHHQLKHLVINHEHLILINFHNFNDS